MTPGQWEVLYVYCNDKEPITLHNLQNGEWVYCLHDNDYSWSSSVYCYNCWNIFNLKHFLNHYEIWLSQIFDKPSIFNDKTSISIKISSTSIKNLIEVLASTSVVTYTDFKHHLEILFQSNESYLWGDIQTFIIFGRKTLHKQVILIAKHPYIPIHRTILLMEFNRTIRNNLDTVEDVIQRVNRIMDGARRIIRMVVT